MIGVMGVTGEVGKKTYLQLLDLSIDKICLLVRDPRKVEDLLNSQVTARQFDFTQLNEKALVGISSLLWILPNNHAELNINEEAWLDLAKSAGVKHIVKLSVMGVTESDIYFRHRISEKRIEDSGIAFTHLRPNTFMQNFNNYELEDIKKSHELRFPTGTGQTSFVDTRDIAAVAVEVLLHPKAHLNRAYTLTGSEALSYGDAARLFSEVLEKDIHYVDITNSTDSNDKFKQDHLFYKAVKKGEYAFVSNEIEKVLNRPALTLKQYIFDYKTIFSN